MGNGALILKDIRKRLNLNQNEFSEKIPIAYNSYAKLEQGRKVTSVVIDGILKNLQLTESEKVALETLREGGSEDDAPPVCAELLRQLELVRDTMGDRYMESGTQVVLEAYVLAKQRMAVWGLKNNHEKIPKSEFMQLRELLFKLYEFGEHTYSRPPEPHNLSDMEERSDQGYDDVWSPLQFFAIQMRDGWNGLAEVANKMLKHHGDPLPEWGSAFRDTPKAVKQIAPVVTKAASITPPCWGQDVSDTDLLLDDIPF